MGRSNVNFLGSKTAAEITDLPCNLCRNGNMVYKSATNKMSVYENGSWNDLV